MTRRPWLTHSGNWGGNQRLGEQLKALWKRMVFNALVGNTDDHALNTGLIFEPVAGNSERSAWGLSPAFDITPDMVSAPQKMEEGPPLSLATGTDGQSGTSVARLLEAAQWLGLDHSEALAWLSDAARQVALQWEPLLRVAASPIIEDASRMNRLVEDVQLSFAHAQWLTQSPALRQSGRDDSP